MSLRTRGVRGQKRQHLDLMHPSLSDARLACSQIESHLQSGDEPSLTDKESMFKSQNPLDSPLTGWLEAGNHYRLNDSWSRC